MGGSGIRVNVIVPGYIETEMTSGISPSQFNWSTTFCRDKYANIQSVSFPAMTPEARSQALNAIPLKRLGETREIADAAVFLATNAYANNCVLNLDGGLSAT
jgi:NAD(P)-dependent dehydrogenase (short-subunit alcohol dehydrogenase family)